MKRTLSIILSALIVSSCQEEIKYTYPSVKIDRYANCTEYDIAPNSDYKEYCECAQENELSFPTEDAEYGRLIIHNGELGDPFQFDNQYYELDQGFISNFRAIVSDSSNFRWGELGTQGQYCIMEFFNASDELINRAVVTSGGMIGLEPSLEIIKWGLPSSEGDDRINSLIDKYIEDKN